jgi:hypothetical protein
LLFNVSFVEPAKVLGRHSVASRSRAPAGASRAAIFVNCSSAASRSSAILAAMISDTYGMKGRAFSISVRLATMANRPRLASSSVATLASVQNGKA